MEPGQTPPQDDPAHVPPTVSEPAPGEAETPPAAEASAAIAESPRPRVRLNPVQNPAELKPVGSQPVGEESPSAASPETPPAVQAELAPVESSPPPRRSEPVSIPRTEELDSEMEASLAAAMQSADLESPVVASAEEGEPPVTEETLTSGAKLKGTIQSVDDDSVFLDLGLRTTGFVPRRQFDAKRPPEVGKVIDIVVDKVSEAEGLIHCNLPRGRARISGDWATVVVGQTTDCQVAGTNKGGLEVTVGSLRGFLPASQVELGFAANLETYVGKVLSVRITEVNAGRRRLIVSRKALLAEERASTEETFFNDVHPGQVRSGTIKTLKDYGAFVDLGGMDGFLHIGQISWQRINKPSDVLREGQVVEVKVVSVDREKKRVALSMRQMGQNPWSSAETRYAQGTKASGKVTRIEQFGAFVELEPGLEGMVHISQLDHKRIGKVEDVLTVGQEIEAQVIEVDPRRKRISLSMKVLIARPEAPKKPADEDLAPGKGQAYERKSKGSLKGGIGGEKRGGLFGDPRSFG
jgi:ribosomal protein S1